VKTDHPFDLEFLLASQTSGGQAVTIATETTYDVVPLSRHIGAEIRGLDLRETLDAGTIRRINQAWLDHAVLLFRGQRLEQEDLLRVTEYFGPVGPLGRPRSSTRKAIRASCRTS
jgi:alpha-ketoglutarate-dependent taurine dioxygenase